MIKPYIKDLYNVSKNLKINKTIKSSYFKRKIKVFKNKSTFTINPNLKYIFKNCSVKEWYLYSNEIEEILKNNDYKLINSKIISTLILTYIKPSCNYLLSSYYHSSSKRIPKIKNKFYDIVFLIKSLMLNADNDLEHLKLLKYKLNHFGISNYKFIFENKLSNINNSNLDQEYLSVTEKDFLKNYLKVNRRKKDFQILKIRADYIYDAFLLFFIDLNKYELSRILFYKENLNYFDYDFEIFVIKEKI